MIIIIMIIIIIIVITIITIVILITNCKFIQIYEYMCKYVHINLYIYIYNVYLNVYLNMWKPFINDKKSFFFHLKSSRYLKVHSCKLKKHW